VLSSTATRIPLPCARSEDTERSAFTRPGGNQSQALCLMRFQIRAHDTLYMHSDGRLRSRAAPAEWAPSQGCFRHHAKRPEFSPSCPIGHRVDISNEKWTLNLRSHNWCRFSIPLSTMPAATCAYAPFLTWCPLTPVSRSCPISDRYRAPLQPPHGEVPNRGPLGRR
jgi:hypothetical protein